MCVRVLSASVPPVGPRTQRHCSCLEWSMAHPNYVSHCTARTSAAVTDGCVPTDQQLLSSCGLMAKTPLLPPSCMPSPFSSLSYSLHPSSHLHGPRTSHSTCTYMYLENVRCLRPTSYLRCLCAPSAFHQAVKILTVKHANFDTSSTPYLSSHSPPPLSSAPPLSTPPPTPHSPCMDIY